MMQPRQYLPGDLIAADQRHVVALVVATGTPSGLNTYIRFDLKAGRLSYNGLIMIDHEYSLVWEKIA
jgi:hypothetical protein